MHRRERIGTRSLTVTGVQITRHDTHWHIASSGRLATGQLRLLVLLVRLLLRPRRDDEAEFVNGREQVGRRQHNVQCRVGDRRVWDFAAKAAIQCAELRGSVQEEAS